MSDSALHRTLRDQPFGLGEWLVEPMYDRIVSPHGSNRVRPRAMDVLVDLRVHAPRVVGTGELIERLWAHTYAEDAAVHHIVAELRKALGDDSRAPRYIGTVPKRGYRLLEPARPLATADAGAVPPGAGGPGQKPSIAVLPFDTICPHPCEEHFARGLHDEIIARLAASPAWEVTSRTSVLRFGTLRDQSLPDIAAALGVGFVLEGTVRLTEQRARITVQLIDANSDLHLWAKMYDARLGDVFDIQAEVARDVATELAVVLPLGGNKKGSDPGV